VIVNFVLTDDQVDVIAARAADIVVERFAQSEAPWLTPEQASQAWGISKSAVYRRAKRGRVESRHEGRNLLVRRP
jgi:hypothetical protein